MQQQQKKKSQKLQKLKKINHSIFKQFDLFGKPISLNFKDEETYKTGFGGFMSLAFLGLLFGLFYRSINSFFNKENIEVASQTLYSSDPSKLTIDPLDMVFALNIRQDDFIKRPYFNITIQDRHYERLEGGEQKQTRTNVELSPCTLEHFTQLNSNVTVDWEEKYNVIGFQDWLCPPLNYEFQLGGMYASDNFYFSKISLSLCQNQTEVIDDTKEYTSACAPQEEIDEFIERDQTFSIYFPNKLVNPDDTIEPVKDFLFDEVFFEIQAGRMYRSANIFFKDVNIQTDESIWLWEEPINEKVILFEPGDFREIVSVGSPSPGEFYLRRSPYSVSHVRKFQKFDDIIAYIGGFIEAVIIGATIIIGFYNEIQYTLDLANKLYHFNNEKNKKNKDSEKINNQIKELYLQDQKAKSLRPKHLAKRSSNRLHSLHAADVKAIIIERQSLLQKIENVNTQQNLNNNGERFSGKKDTLKIDVPNQYIVKKNSDKLSNSINSLKNCQNQRKNQIKQRHKIYEGLGFKSRQQFLESQFQEILDRETELTLSFKYIFNKLTCGCCFKTEEVKLINIAKDKIGKDLDIYMIIDNIKEIEKLKSVLFDKDQERLFNFFPKPVISIEQDEGSKNFLKFRDMQSKHQLSTTLNNNKKDKNQKYEVYESKYQTETYKNLTIVEIAMAQKAASKFKKQLIKIRKQKLQGTKNLSTFQNLYHSYDILTKKQEKNILIRQQNQRLFNQLGIELKTIFETSQLIKFEHEDEEIPVSKSQISSQQTIPLTSQNQIQSNSQLPQIQNNQSRIQHNLQQNQSIDKKQGIQNNNDISNFINNQKQFQQKEEKSQRNNNQLQEYNVSGRFGEYNQDQSALSFGPVSQNETARNMLNSNNQQQQYQLQEKTESDIEKQDQSYSNNKNMDYYVDDESKGVPSENEEQWDNKNPRDKIQIQNSQKFAIQSHKKLDQ